MHIGRGFGLRALAHLAGSQLDGLHVDGREQVLEEDHRQLQVLRAGGELRQSQGNGLRMTNSCLNPNKAARVSSSSCVETGAKTSSIKDLVLSMAQHHQANLDQTTIVERACFFTNEH